MKKAKIAASPEGRELLRKLWQDSGKTQDGFCTEYPSSNPTSKDKTPINRTNFSQIINGYEVYRPSFIRVFEQLGLDWTQYAANAAYDAALMAQAEAAAKALATNFKVPYLRNQFFTGRQDILEDVHHALTQESAVAITQVKAISGLGGIGKTQTAVEYAYRYFYDTQTYDYVFWIRSDSAEILHNEFANIASQLALPIATGGNTQDIIQVVKAWFTNNNNWLLIFDNADEPSILVDYIPPNPTGKILLTSRADMFDMLGIAAPQMLGAFAEIESVDFLFRRTNRERTDEQQIAAVDLHKELEGLPLALEQAAAYMVRKRLSFPTYLNLYRKRGVGFLERTSPQMGKYPTSVLRTWTLNFEAVQEESPDSVEALKICAFLASGSILLTFALSCGMFMGESTIEILRSGDTDEIFLVVGNMLSPLAQYSLIQWQSEEHFYFDIHRLVQAVMRDSLSVEEIEEYIDKAIKVLLASAPQELEKSSKKYNFYLTAQISTVRHGGEIAGYAKSRSIHTEMVGHMWLLLGRTMLSLNNFKYAEAAFVTAVDVFSKKDGISDIETQISLFFHMGICGFSQKLYTAVKPCFEKAKELSYESENRKIMLFCEFYLMLIDIFENEAETEIPRILKQSLDNTLEKSGKDDTVENDYIEDCDGSDESPETLFDVVSPDDPDSCDLVYLAALIAQKSGLLQQADDLFRVCIQLSVNHYGIDHPATFQANEGLAGVFLEGGHYEAAEKVYKEVIRSQLKQRYYVYSGIEGTMFNLACVFARQEKHEQAAVLFEDAISINKYISGPQLNSVRMRHALGLIYTQLHEYRKAEKHLRQAGHTAYNLLGKEHHSLIGIFSAYALVLGHMKDAPDYYRCAEYWFRTAIRLNLKIFGEEPKLMAHIQNFASFLYYGERYKEAASLLRYNINLHKRFFPDELAERINYLAYLANAIFAQGKTVEAWNTYQEIFSILEELWGRESERLINLRKGVVDKLSKPFMKDTGAAQFVNVKFPKRFQY